MDRDQKLRTRLVIVKVILSLELNDIHQILANENKWISMRQEMVDTVLKTFPELTAEKVKDFIDSCIGNVLKSYEDLRDNKPDGIDLAKLQLWREVWIREKEKNSRADDFNSRFILSKKMRMLHATQAEASSFDHPLAREDALVRTEFNSECTFTIGIPKKAISILCKLGSGAYGTVSKCQINGISFLVAAIPLCCKEFKGGAKSQFKNFGLESSIDLLHPGIVRPVAHTRGPPWMLIFPYFNRGSLGDILEMVPYPANLAKMVAIQEGNGKTRLPIHAKKVSEEQRRYGHNPCLHAPALIHAFVQALVHAHGKGVLDNDLHPWNIMIDFIAAGVPRIGIIDWGLAMRAGIEQRVTNITNQLQHKIRPWRADELLAIKHPCPWTYATDVFAAAWVIDAICKFCFEYSEWASTDWATTRTSVDIQTIAGIIEKSFLKKKPEERDTMADLDEALQQMELQPLQCLRPLSEMNPIFI